ncbi:hypothetical protein NQZ68_014845 [Dissostichus eleginoides]|nr:hypothetical protein NQZ68_014845 [Dissostichus eleginoides]
MLHRNAILQQPVQSLVHLQPDRKLAHTVRFNTEEHGDEAGLRLANTGGHRMLQSFVGPAVYSHSLHFWSFISSPSSLGGCLSLSPGFCASQSGIGTVSDAAGPHKLHTLLEHSVPHKAPMHHAGRAAHMAPVLL